MTTAISLPFTKMHGLGNDFVLISATDAERLGLCPERNRETLEKLAAYLCDRRFGIGADGLILPARSSDPTRFDTRFVYLNSDGSWAEMCGNGIRCFALFARDTGVIQQDRFTAETPAGPISPEINPDRTVTVNMGTPVLIPERVPFSVNGVSEPVQNHPLRVLDREIPVTPVGMGNPHCLVFQDDFTDRPDPAVFGPALETHPAFPAKTNVEFIEVLDRSHIKVIVWERGCGFTLACGTGACAAAVGAIRAGKVEHDVDVALPGGSLRIRWDGDPASPVWMSGPAAYAFRGEIEIPAEILASAPVSAG